MNLEAFLHHLHFDIDKTRPPDWKVDWDDAPLAYKLYRGLPVFRFSSELPLTLKEREVPVKPNLREIGHFLWYIFGLTQFCQSVYSLDSTEKTVGLMQQSRRFVPSGGALYPNELYVYLKLEGIPTGVYHYDAAHHRLVLLREGNFDSYLTQALGHRCEVSACFGTVLVSTMFWKNFFKYNNLAYRLQGLDAGVLIGQLLEVAKRFAFASTVYFQFLDRAVNHLIGLSEQEESVYAVIPLSVEPEVTWFGHGNANSRTVTATELCRMLTSVKHHHYVRSQRILEYPMLIKMNEASLLESMPSFRHLQKEKVVKCEGQTVTLPFVNRLPYDLAAVCRKRYSPGMDFVLGKVSQRQLSALLREAIVSFSYRNDLDGALQSPESRVSLSACLYGVEGIPDGAYHYDSTAHTLRQRRLGDYRLWLQQGMLIQDINIFQIPLCLHVIGYQHYNKKTLGYRGYRIQQMEAGMLVQRLLLTSSALGMGGHPLLGFDVRLCDEIYKIAPEGKTSLIQIVVGPYRPHPRFQGILHA